MTRLLHLAAAPVRTLRRDRQLLILGAVAMKTLTIGSIFYWQVEGWRLLDSLYFSFITLATVGFGDFTPKTDAGKLFTMVYICVGVGILLSFYTRLARHLIKADPVARAVRSRGAAVDDELDDEDRRAA
jgi:hypothetical protein